MLCGRNRLYLSGFTFSETPMAVSTRGPHGKKRIRGARVDFDIKKRKKETGRTLCISTNHFHEMGCMGSQIQLRDALISSGPNSKSLGTTKRKPRLTLRLLRLRPDDNVIFLLFVLNYFILFYYFNFFRMSRLSSGERRR